MTVDLSAFGSGFLGMLLGSGIVALWLKHLTGRMRHLAGTIETLKDQEMKRLEHRMDALESGCVGREVKTSLKNLEGWMTKIDNRLERIAEETAGQRERIKANAHYVQNVDATFKAHRDNMRLHGNG